MARIILSGNMIRDPRGGATLWYLGWLVGLQRNGHDVYFVERSEWPDDCYVVPERRMTSDCFYGVQVIRQLLKKYGLEEKWCFVDHFGTYHGLNKPTVDGLFKTADLFVDLGWWAQWQEEAVNCRLRVFVDGEPGWFQIRIKKWVESGITLPHYDFFFTDGCLIGTDKCDVPTSGINWNHCLPPVLLDEIKKINTNGKASFTTVMNWGDNKTVEHEGKVYGHKEMEFDKFIGLPGCVTETMELAVSGQKVPLQQLTDFGWRIKQGDDISLSKESYLNYIAGSKGEFSVAKNAYVQTQCGWFGDRSGYYLANGKPVVLQETGFSQVLPCGKGLISFETMEEAANAIKMISSDYSTHSKAAIEIANDYLGAERVTNKFLDQIGI